MLFLQSAPVVGEPSLESLALLGAGFLFFLFVLIVAVYVYSSFAYMAIARKAKYRSPGLVWIPIVGPMIMASKTAKMHWWPILLLVVFWIPFINILCMIALLVFNIIWMWKTFEKIGKPGWWSVFMIINIVYLVLLGIAAWSKK